jgi:GNAT superfamily N-acetyltransferase
MFNTGSENIDNNYWISTNGYIQGNVLPLFPVIIVLPIVFTRSRLVVLPDYQGIGVGKRLLTFIAELYTSQTKMPFYILTSNPQIIRGGMKNWEITRFGQASKGRGNTRINNEIKDSLSRKRITVSMQYIPKLTTQLDH